jgi:hypothetical protein
VFHISKLHFIQPRYSIMLDAAAVSPLFKCWKIDIYLYAHFVE